MRKLALMLAQCLLLAGCTGLPQPREMGEMALLRTVGVDLAGDGVSLTVSTGARSAGVEGETQSALLLKGEGESLTAAALDLSRKSDSYVFFGYVDKLLLGQPGGELSGVLEWLSQDGELGLGAKTWLIREGRAASAVEQGGDEGVERRLSALELDAKLGIGPMTRSAGEIFSALLDKGCTFIPGLAVGEELTDAGYGVVTTGGLVGWLDENAARGLELLAEHPMAQSIEVDLDENPVSLRLRGAQLDCRPIFDRGELVRLDLTVRAQVKVAHFRTEPDLEQREALSRAAGEVLEGQVRLALEQLRDWKCDCVGIGSRVAIAAPWHWKGLEGNWPDTFAGVDYTLRVEAALI